MKAGVDICRALRQQEVVDRGRDQLVELAVAPVRHVEQLRGDLLARLQLVSPVFLRAQQRERVA